ncbi:spermine oxidase, partial [Leptinotarsa decemlineata]|uniref:spermine oxidase n=1 Tax=Leptinotarsa decemlineata TaxID=7539 RepID=UPI003D3081DC
SLSTIVDNSHCFNNQSSITLKKITHKLITKFQQLSFQGAGPAGIAAATKLLENNLTNIKILEAEPRIGGRIKSVKFGDSYVDLGARWCHGEDGNIVYNMVKDLHLLNSTKVAESFFLSSREEIEETFGKELMGIFYEMSDLPSSDSKDKYKSVGEVCEQRYRKTIQDKFSANPIKLKIANEALGLLESFISSNEGAFSWYDSSFITDFKNCDGDFHLNFNGKGYKIILDVMMKKYPDPRRSLPIDDKIFLNKEVTQVSWNSHRRGGNIKIKCSDNSIYTADHVITTPSVGVLKERAKYMFLPKLPTEKLKAIDEVGFGAVMKVIMHFSVNWWGNSPGFSFIWTEEDKIAVLREFPEGPTWNDRSWLTFIDMIVMADNNPNVFTVWFTGKLVPAIEFLSDELIIKGINFTLNKFLGHLYNIGEPDKILRSNWYANPHFRGTYSFQTVQSRLANEKKSVEEHLAAPLTDLEGRPIVLFAGEATHPHYYSTVHGAIESGYREAHRLLDLHHRHQRG